MILLLSSLRQSDKISEEKIQAHPKSSFSCCYIAGYCDLNQTDLLLLSLFCPKIISFLSMQQAA